MTFFRVFCFIFSKQQQQQHINIEEINTQNDNLHKSQIVYRVEYGERERKKWRKQNENNNKKENKNCSTWHHQYIIQMTCKHTLMHAEKDRKKKKDRENNKWNDQKSAHDYGSISLFCFSNKVFPYAQKLLLLWIYGIITPQERQKKKKTSHGKEMRLNFIAFAKFKIIR